MTVPTVDERSGRRGLVVVLLLLILLAAFALRVFHVDWADGQLPHPDERSTVAFYAPTIHWPSSEGVSPLDKRQSPLNPLWDVGRQERRSYTYGHFPLYLLVLTANGLNKLAPAAEQLGASAALVESLRTANGVPGFAFVGRTLMAISDTFTVLLVFLLAHRIYGRRKGGWWVGLLAAAFSAFTVLQIQLSHFFAVDPISTTFTLLALYGALRLAEDRSMGWSIVAGLGSGLAIASKFSALPILAAPVVAGVLIAWRTRSVAPSSARPSAGRIVGLVGVALVVALAAFAVTSPFAILDWENFKQAVLIEQGAMVRGEADFPFTRQYRGTPPYLYFVEQNLRWGIGWPLGLLAFLALAWALAKLLFGKARNGEIILLSWIIPYFGLTGLFLAKFMRYMVPVVPLLMVLAAGLIATIWYGEFWRRRARGLAALLAAVALLGAVLWSLAYVNGVYNTSHPWIKASHWMYTNLADGSTIGWEQWDDSLPYDLPEPSSSRGRFQFTDWGPFEEDTAEKYERLKEFLRRSDAIALSSNRIYGAVDNLPERYPLTNRYYQLLFEGKLGFELALEQTNHPNLLSIAIDDEKADESFTLYDHPRVLVFRKLRDLSDAELDALLGGSWQGAKPWDVGEPPLIQRLWSLLEPQDGGAPASKPEPGPGEGKSLLLDQPLDELPVVQDFRWNVLASRSTPLAVLVWWLAISMVGWVTWPITFGVFRNLRDRGYLLSRSLGWLLLGYIVWIVASLGIAENRLLTIWIVLALIAVLSFAMWRRQRAAMAAYWRGQKRLVLFGEGLFAAAYLLFVAFRIGNPDIWQPWNGGEKFMEFAFLNAILRSPTFPPIDPYFAGGTINYYYFGHYLVALLTKLTGIWSSVAFNLAIATVFALTIVNTYCIGANLASGLSTKKAARRGSQARQAEPDASPVAMADPQSANLSVETNLPASESVAISGDQPPAESVDAPQPSSEILADEPVFPPQTHPVSSAHATTSEPFSRGVVLSGLLAAFFVAMLGNVDGGGQVVRKLAELSTSNFQSNLPGAQTAVRAVSGLANVLGPATLPSYNYWDPSRVIPYTINEFPYWSFLFADLHPHMIGIGFTVLFLALAYNLLAGWGSTSQPSSPTAGAARRVVAGVAKLTGDGLYVVMALTLGALAVINTWDLPTYFGLAMLVWLMLEWRRSTPKAGARNGEAGRTSWSWPRSMARTVVFGLGLAAAAILLYLPFFAHYEALASSGIGINQVKDDLGKWLNMWAFLVFLAVTFVLVELRRRAPARRQVDGPNDGQAQPAPRDPAFLRWLRVALNRLADLARWVELTPTLSARLLAVAGLALGLTLVLWLTGWRVPAVLLLPLLGAFALLWRRQASPESLFVSALLFTAFLVLMGVEFVYLKDHLQGGDWRRMNTLFKFYIQVWVMLGVGAAVALPTTWHFVQTRWRLGWRVVWTAVFAYLLLLSLVFLVAGTRARLDDRFPRENGRPPVGTLDGMAYMSAGTYTWHPDPAQAPTTRIELRYDYDALRWLLDHVEGTPVVAESLIGYYREGGLRVASFTGFPTLLGFHQEGEQRYGWQTGQRRELAEEFWRTSDHARTRQLIDELGIDLVYIGQLERINLPQSAEKFQAMADAGMLEVLYQNDKVVIYQPVRPADEPATGAD